MRWISLRIRTFCFDGVDQKDSFLLTSTTPAAATASAFPSSAEEGSLILLRARRVEIP